MYDWKKQKRKASQLFMKSAHTAEQVYTYEQSRDHTDTLIVACVTQTHGLHLYVGS